MAQINEKILKIEIVKEITEQYQLELTKLRGALNGTQIIASMSITANLFMLGILIYMAVK